jgi:hypothetical protein
MDSVRIPVDEPVTFTRLRELNPDATAGELADIFPHLPAELRQQAWNHLRLTAALDEWNRAAKDDDETP